MAAEKLLHETILYYRLDLKLGTLKPDVNGHITDFVR